MKTTAAVLFEAGKPFELMELDLDGPGPGEVLVKYTAAGLCHSDLHLTDGDLPPRFPIVGGHEGSGVIEEVGAGVTRVKPGDHVVCSFIPNCGTCRYCCTGRQNLCDMGATILEGCMPDGSFRFHSQGTDFGAMCMLGTFAERATVSQHSVVKVDDWLPLETAVLVVICPWADLAVDIEATRPALRDPLILPSMCTEWAPRYVGSSDPRLPGISPVYGDMSGLPPIVMQTAGDDPICVDADKIETACAASKTSIEHRRFAGMWHDFHLQVSLLPEARDAIADLGARLRGHLHQSQGQPRGVVK